MQYGTKVHQKRVGREDPGEGGNRGKAVPRPHSPRAIRGRRQPGQPGCSRWDCLRGCSQPGKTTLSYKPLEILSEPDDWEENNKNKQDQLSAICFCICLSRSERAGIKRHFGPRRKERQEGKREECLPGAPAALTPGPSSGSTQPAEAPRSQAAGQ